jgi:hypothetical protein
VFSFWSVHGLYSSDSYMESPELRVSPSESQLGLQEVLGPEETQQEL